MIVLGLGLVLLGGLAGLVTTLIVHSVISSRNRDLVVRYRYEVGTDTAVANLRSGDELVGENNRQRSTTISAMNSTSPLVRVQKIQVR
ncbi:hypothetical protein [Brachybacterium hainanense]|uniref:DUF3592 domain-containing protein n=1 Tax=Brachybacterium hainanense TaxID=1541174 RepID=A0ABV6REB4_9MICO